MNISQHCFVPLRMELATSGRQSVWYFRDSAEQGYPGYCTYTAYPYSIFYQQPGAGSKYRVFNRDTFPLMSNVLCLLFKVSGARYDVRLFPLPESQNQLGNTLRPDVIDEEEEVK